LLQTEWNGAWSDKSEEWTKHPDIAKQLKVNDANDGLFWISFDDFVDNFSVLWWN